MGYSKHVRRCDIAVIETTQRHDVDMYVRTNSSCQECVWEFQIAEVKDPDSPRGKMYRDMAKGKMRTSPYQPQREMQEGLRWLAEAAQKKVNKGYANSAGLHVLLYANFQTEALRYKDVRLALLRFSAHFASMWVITALDLCSVFSAPSLGQVSRLARVRPVEEAHKD